MLSTLGRFCGSPPTPQPLLFLLLRAHCSSVGIRCAMSALHEQGSDPQPTRAFLHCRLLPHCCEPFAQTAAQFQPLEGPCEFSSLKQADFFAAFPSFITVRVKPKHFPHSLGRHPPVGAYTSILPPSQTFPCMSLPSAHPQGPRLILCLFMIEFEDGK